MYAITRIFLPVMALIALASCIENPADKKTSGKLQGLHKYYYPEGQLYIEINYKDSLPHGMFRQYFKSGQIFEETQYFKGVKHGKSRRFYDNGRPSSDAVYDNGRLHGIKKKYRKDGTIAYEAPYYYDHPCVGLKEFYTSGNPVDTYPKIVVEFQDELARANQYTLLIRMSNNSKSVQFYTGKLSQDRFVGKDAEEMPVENGTGRLTYTVPKGAFVHQSLNIIAKAKTELNNYMITQAEYKLSIENY